MQGVDILIKLNSSCLRKPKVRGRGPPPPPPPPPGRTPPPPPGPPAAGHFYDSVLSPEQALSAIQKLLHFDFLST